MYGTRPGRRPAPGCSARPAVSAATLPSTASTPSALPTAAGSDASPPIPTRPAATSAAATSPANPHRTAAGSCSCGRSPDRNRPRTSARAVPSSWKTSTARGYAKSRPTVWPTRTTTAWRTGRRTDTPSCSPARTDHSSPSDPTARVCGRSPQDPRFREHAKLVSRRQAHRVLLLPRRRPAGHIHRPIRRHEPGCRHEHSSVRRLCRLGCPAVTRRVSRSRGWASSARELTATLANLFKLLSLWLRRHRAAAFFVATPPRRLTRSWHPDMP